jgi:anti-anti-sigma factor
MKTPAAGRYAAMHRRITIPKMDQMDIARESGTNGNTQILRLKGPLTLTTLFGLQQILREIGNSDTIVDVTDVPYMDSAGLGTILSHWAHTQRASAKFAVTGVSPRIAVLFEVTKVNTVLPIFPTVAEAESSFSAEKNAAKA